MTLDVKRMSTKKGQSTANDNSLNLKKAGEFVGDVKGEFKKISWTEPDQLKTYTKVVVGATFVFGLGIYLLDLAIQGGLMLIEKILRVILG